MVGGAGDCDGFFVAASEVPWGAFRFSGGFILSSDAPIMGNVGPSLEYGGVAAIVVVFASFSDEDVNMSLMRCAFAMLSNRVANFYQKKSCSPAVYWDCCVFD